MYKQIIIFFALLLLGNSYIYSQKIIGKEALNKGEAFMRTNLDSAIFYMDKARLIFKEQNEWEQFLYTNNKYAQLLYFQYANNTNNIELWDLSSEIFKESEKIGTEKLSSEHEMVINALNGLGMINQVKGNQETAKDYYKKAISNAVKNSPTLPKLYTNVGSLYIMTQQPDSAMKYLNTAISISEELKDNRFLALSYSRLGAVLSMKGEYKQAEELLIKQIEFYKNSVDEIPDKFIKLGELCNNLANLYVEIARFSSARKMYENAIMYLEKDENVLKDDIADCYANLGVLSNELGKYKEALDYLNKASNLAGTNQSKSNILNTKGISYSRLQDLSTAIEYFKKSIEINPTNFISYSNLGKLYSEIQDFNKATEVFKNALLFANNKKDSFSVCLNLGLFYDRKKQSDSSMYYTELAVELIKNRESNEIDLSMGYHDLGYGYLTLKEYDKALSYLHKSLLIRKKLLPNSHRLIMEATVGIAKVHYEYHNLDSALYYSYKAESIIGENYSYTEIDDIDLAINTLNLIGLSLKKKFNKTKNIDYLLQAYEYDKKNIKLINKSIVNLISDKSQKWYREKTYKIFDRGISNATTLYNLTDRFNYIEEAITISNQSKALILKYNIISKRENSMLQIEGLEDILRINKEIGKVNSSITDINNKLIESKNTTSNNSEFLRDEKLLEILKDKKFKLTDDLSNIKKSNLIFKLLYDEDILDLETKKLDKNQALIDYYIADKKIHVFILQSNKVDYVEIEKPNDFSEKIKQFMYLVRTYEGILNYEDKFKQVSYELYTLLFKDIQDKLNENIARIVVIPNQELWNLNFELLSESTDGENANSNLLIKKYAFSRSESISLFLNNQQHKIPVQSVSVMYPISPDNEYFTSSVLLPAIDTKEAKLIENVLGADKTVINQGVKANFEVLKSSLKSNEITHIITHGMIDDNNPWESFILLGKYDTTMVYELANGMMSSKLLIMNACQTSYSNELRMGEGFISITWALRAAGCQSIISGLWDIQQKPSEYIMSKFYFYIKNGEPLDVSLQKAKLDYLEKEGEYDKVYNWGATICTGNTPSFSFD